MSCIEELYNTPKKQKTQSHLYMYKSDWTVLSTCILMDDGFNITD